MISHFHADHFFGLPFLLLDAWHEGRTDDLEIVGPPGIERRAENLLELAFPEHELTALSYRRHYTEVSDGATGEVCGVRYEAAEVEQAPGLECFAYRVDVQGKTLVFAGDATLCDALVNLVRGADVLVLECSCAGDAVHLSPSDVAQIVDAAGPNVQAIVTHLDAIDEPDAFRGLHAASDLCRFSLSYLPPNHPAAR